MNNRTYGNVISIYTGNLNIDSGVATVTPQSVIIAPSVGDLHFRGHKGTEKSARLKFLNSAIKKEM